MDFSVFFFANDANAGSEGYGLLLDAARFADTNGFTAVWTPERHFHSFGGQYPNPAVTGAALATATERLEIRAGSVVAPLHHPLRIAEEWSMVDNLSGGRAGISFASGWHSVDFVLEPENYADRKAIMTRSVDTVRKLWRGERIEFTDPGGVQRPVRVFPRPVRPELPVWITSAGSTDTFRSAGTLGAGVLTHLLGQDYGTLAGNVAAYREAFATTHGHERRGHVVLMLHTLLGTERDEVKALARGPFSDYLRGSIDLVVGRPNGTLPTGFDPTRLPERDKEFLVARSFERYFSTGGLFGTVDDGIGTVRAIAALGVDEIACLIDFGVPDDAVLRSLEHVADLRARLASEVASDVSAAART